MADLTRPVKRAKTAPGAGDAEVQGSVENFKGNLLAPAPAPMVVRRPLLRRSNATAHVDYAALLLQAEEPAPAVVVQQEQEVALKANKLIRRTRSAP